MGDHSYEALHLKSATFFHVSSRRLARQLGRLGFIECRFARGRSFDRAIVALLQPWSFPAQCIDNPTVGVTFSPPQRLLRPLCRTRTASPILRRSARPSTRPAI